MVNFLFLWHSLLYDLPLFWLDHTVVLFPYKHNRVRQACHDTSRPRAWEPRLAGGRFMNPLQGSIRQIGGLLYRGSTGV